MDIENRFAHFIAQQALFTKGDRILLAVSGGKDSVLMAHLLAGQGYSMGIAHCNFQLRGGESDADELLVSDLAATLAVPFHVKHFDTLSFAQLHHISVEMAARELRYSWFEELRLAYRYTCVAVAHHQNDSTETILFNLIRGTGVAGIHGILPKRGPIVRPLLFLTRDEIDEEVERRALAFRDDSSNFSSQYARNKIRLEVIPKLKEINPSLERTFVENAKRFEELHELLNIYADGLRKKLFRPLDMDNFRIEIKALQKLHPLRTLLYELFKPYGFTGVVLEDLIRIWHRDDRSGKVFYSPTHQLMVDRADLFLQVLKPPQEIQPVCLFPNEQKAFGEYQVKLYEVRPIQTDDTDTEKKQHMVVLDADHLMFPLSVRAWQRGDRFQPLGMGGKKKLSDFFVSLKLPNSKKEKIPIFLNGNGDILWVAPFRMDDRYKITDKTKKVITLECI